MLYSAHKNLTNLVLAVLLAFLLNFYSCNPIEKPSAKPFTVEHPQWALNATIYEVNIRQYTVEGTFEAFEEHLPRLSEMGVKILWLMPIHPIGELERKGTLGSYYSVKDYKGVNPEFGTMVDFKRLVSKAHSLGMKVIIDWVANHTSHDNHLVYDHSDWYQKDSLGNIISPFDWTDVAQLDFDNAELRDYMIEALKFWVTEADIDGFRCDVAAMVPTDFWNRARAELDEIKPVFMLAEADALELQEHAFDCDYSWELHHIMNSIAQGKMSVLDLKSYFKKELASYPKNTIRMQFTSNHDENSWSGTEFERMGVKASQAFAALTFTIPGLPLIYSGQEVAFNRRLQFFDKDLIDWDSNHPYIEFYCNLIGLKNRNSTLWAGESGADMVRISTTNDVNVFAFIRKNDNDQLIAIFNLSNLKQRIVIEDEEVEGNYIELFSQEEISFGEHNEMDLEPWQFFIYELNNQKI